MTKDEALKMAIEAMENIHSQSEPNQWHWNKLNNAIQACKEALAQPAQEPYVEPTYYVLHPDGTYSEAIPQPSRY